MAAPKGMKDYNRIRRFLEQIYLYGFFSREDFERAGIGGVKDYDFGAGLLRTLYPEMDADARWQGGKKYLRFQREYAKSGEDRLADSYLLHAIKEEELLQVLCILSACSRRPRTLDELCAAVELTGLESEGAVYPTVRRRVLELEQYGYLRRKGKQIYMPDNLLAGLGEEELLALEDYVRFSAGVTYPRVAGSFLRRSIRRELERRGQKEREESPFLLRGNVKCNIFDEEVVDQLLDAIKERRSVEMDLGTRRVTAVPVALRADVRMGRWYVLAMERHPLLFRVRSIRKIKPLKTLEEETWQTLREEVCTAYHHSLCSGRRPPQGEPILVRARLAFHSFPGMRAQFLREMQVGEVREENGVEYYQVLVNDPEELVPFLRSFSPWLQVEPGEHELPKRLQEDLARMREALDHRGRTKTDGTVP